MPLLRSARALLASTALGAVLATLVTLSGPALASVPAAPARAVTADLPARSGAMSGASPWFGVLEPGAGTVGTLAPAGLSRATLELGWDSYEPSRWTFDPGYLQQVRARYAALRAAGLDVVLDAGLQYPPAWVFAVGGGTRFVNQYGDVWHGSTGADVADAVFNLRVRRAQGEYLARLGADLRDLPFAAIRVGGLFYGELHYPTAAYAGHLNSFWAYSTAAQSRSPVPAYRPGQADPVAASTFLNFYLSSLSGYAAWLTTIYRRSFGPSPRLQVLEPSWGVRPGEVAQAAQGLLRGATSGELRGTLNEGLDWARELPAFALVGGVEMYTTWLDAPDQGSDSSLESPVRYLVGLARPLGLPVAGENTGNNSYGDMALCVQRVSELGLTGMMWMRDDDLRDGVHASLDDYRSLIAG